MDSDATRVDVRAETQAAPDLNIPASLDPFVPFDEMPHCTTNIITFRAAIVGILCGVLVNASNIYIGLRAGWTSSANVLGVSHPHL